MYDPIDIDHFAPAAYAPTEGLLAMLGERRGATRGILPADLGGGAPAKPTKPAKPAEPASTSSANAVEKVVKTKTPTTSTDQGRQGASNNTPPSDPSPPVSSTPAIERKVTRKGDKKQPPVSSTSSNEQRVDDKGTDKPKGTDKVKGKDRDERGGADDDTQPGFTVDDDGRRVPLRGDQAGNSGNGNGNGNGTRNDDGGGTGGDTQDQAPAFTINEDGRRVPLRGDQTGGTGNGNGNDDRNGNGSDDSADPVGPPPRDPELMFARYGLDVDGGRLEPTGDKKDKKDKDGAGDDAPADDVPFRGSITALEHQLAQEAEKADDDKVLDKQYTKKELEEIQAAQDRLERKEQKVRDRNKPDQTDQVTEQLPRNRFVLEEAGEIDATTRTTRKEEIKALRQEHIDKYGVWVDADGTVYSASVNENGRIVGVRQTHTPPKGEDPATIQTRTVTIGVMNHRFDKNRLETVPTGEPGEVNQVRVERLHTGPLGHTRNSSLTLRQERERRDGSVVRRRTREEYDAKGRPTTLEDYRTDLDADGKVVAREGQTSYFREDGTTDHTEYEKTTFDGGDTEDRRMHVRATTYFRADGTTPRNEMVVTEGWDANGNEPMTTYESTEFNKAGIPLSTFIRRELPATDGYGQGDGGELEEHVEPREYIKWNHEDGTIAGRAAGGSGLTESEFEAFIEDGTTPELRDVDEDKVDELEERVEANEQILEQLEADKELYGDDYEPEHYDFETGEYISMDEVQEMADADKAELEELKDDLQYNDDHRIDEVPLDVPLGSEEAKRYERTTQNGDDGRWNREGQGYELAPPLQPSEPSSSVFEVPAMLETSSNAATLDKSEYAKNPAKLDELIQEQEAYEGRLGGAKTDAQRERIMREYLSTHDVWVDRGANGTSEPVLMAAGWTEGGPQSSSVFGADRQADPHGVLARTGIQGQDTEGNPATIDVVKHLYTDGSRDELLQTSFEARGGASRVAVTGEHFNPRGVITERDTTVESTIPRQRERKEPLAVTEITRERFDERTGKPRGEQYAAVATSDSTTTSLEEQRDYYDENGVIFDTKIDATQMTRTFDEDRTRGFLDANAAAIEAASKGKDGFQPDDEEFQSIDIPAVGSSWQHAETDIDYDAKGRAIFKETVEESLRVVASDPEFDTDDNGVKVIETDSTTSWGERGGYEPIFNKDGEPIVDRNVKSTITTTEFDPDDGTAGGDGNENNQFRSISTVTVGQTIDPSGDVKKAWSTPLQVDTLQEGSDDDWGFERKYLKTSTDTKDGAPFEVVFNDDDPPAPVELGKGDEVYNSDGELVVKEHDGRTEGDLDSWDHFEEFMGGAGGWIVAGVAVTAGIAGAIFTGGTSAVAGILIATSVLAGSATAAAATTNYLQGEGSFRDAALAIAGTVVPGAGAILARSAKLALAANAARGAGAGAADDVVRAATTKVAAARTATVSEVGLDGYDAIEASRAALQGNYAGLGILALAIAGGAAAPRISARVNGNRGATDTPDDVPAIEGGGAGAPDLTPAPLGPDGVPDITDGTLPRDRNVGGRDNDGDQGGQGDVTGTRGARNQDGAIPLPGPSTRTNGDADSEVGGAHGAPDAGAQRTDTPATQPLGGAFGAAQRGNRVIDTPAGPRFLQNERTEPVPDVTFGRNEQKKFAKHVAAIAPNLAGRNWNADVRARFRAEVDTVVGGARSGDGFVSDGTYQGQPAIFAYQQSTNRLVVLHPNGEFWSGWSPNQGQLDGITQFGTLGQTNANMDFGAMLGAERGDVGPLTFHGTRGQSITGLEGTGIDPVTFPDPASSTSQLPANVADALGTPPANRHGVDAARDIDRPAELGPLDAADSARLQDLVSRALGDLDVQVVTNRHDLPEIIARGGDVPNVGAIRNPRDGRGNDILEQRPIVEQQLGTNADGRTQYAGLYFSRTVRTPDGQQHPNLGQSAYGPDAVVLDPSVLWRSTITGRDSFDVDPTDASQLPGSIEDINYVVSRRVAESIGPLDGRSDAEILDAINTQLTSSELNRSYFEVQIRDGFSLDDVAEIRTNPIADVPRGGDRPGTNRAYLDAQAVRRWADANGIPLTEVAPYFRRNTYGGLEYTGTNRAIEAQRLADVQRQHDAALAPEGLVSRPSWMTPQFLERMGRLAEPTTQRANETPGLIPGTSVRRVQPGRPVDLASLDTNQKYLWVVDGDGTFHLAAEQQLGRTLKHGNLIPASEVGGRAAARAGGELSFVGGRWVLNNDSSYAFARLQDGYQYTGRHDADGFAIIRDRDGNEIAIDPRWGADRAGNEYRDTSIDADAQLDAVTDLLHRSGTDLTDVHVDNVLRRDLPSRPAIPQRAPRDVTERAFMNPPVGPARSIGGARNGSNNIEGELWVYPYRDPVTGTIVEGLYKPPHAGGPIELYGARAAHAFGLGEHVPTMIPLADGGALIEILPGQTFSAAGVTDDASLRAFLEQSPALEGLSPQARVEVMATFDYVHEISDRHPGNGIVDAANGHAYLIDFGYVADGGARNAGGPVALTDDFQPVTDANTAANAVQDVRLSPEALAFLRNVDTDALRAAHADLRRNARPADAGPSVAGVRFDRAADPQFIETVLARLDQLQRDGGYQFVDWRRMQRPTPPAAPVAGQAATPTPTPSATPVASTAGSVTPPAARRTPWSDSIRDRISQLDARTVGRAALRAPLMTTHTMNAAIQTQAQIDRQRIMLQRQLDELRATLETIASMGGGFVQQ